MWASASAASGGKFVGQPGVAEFVPARNLVGFEPGVHRRAGLDIIDGWATTRLLSWLGNEERRRFEHRTLYCKIEIATTLQSCIGSE